MIDPKRSDNPNENKVTVVYTSDKGKELCLRVDTHSPLLVFFWKGGGELPQELDGKFTGTEMAQKAINLWRNRVNREEESGKKIDPVTITYQPVQPPEEKKEPVEKTGLKWSFS